MMEHKLVEVSSREGLYECPVCKGSEGTLPTECPGAPMSMRVQDRVIAGLLDFKGGQWVQIKRPMILRYPGAGGWGMDRWGSA